MGKDDASRGSLRAGDALQFLHEVGIGQSMKAQPLQAGFLVVSRYGQKFRHAGHVPVKRGVEACDVENSREAPAECLNQSDFSGQVGQIQALGPPQSGYELIGDRLMLKQVESPMDHAVADPGDGHVGSVM